MSTPKIEPNPSGCDDPGAMLAHHAVRLTWPDGSKCDLVVQASALRPGAAYSWAHQVGGKARAALGQAIADVIALDLSDDPVLTQWGKMAGLREQVAQLRVERDTARAMLRDALSIIAPASCDLDDLGDRIRDLLGAQTHA